MESNNSVPTTSLSLPKTGKETKEPHHHLSDKPDPCLPQSLPQSQRTSRLSSSQDSLFLSFLPGMVQLCAHCMWTASHWVLLGRVSVGGNSSLRPDCFITRDILTAQQQKPTAGRAQVGFRGGGLGRRMLERDQPLKNCFLRDCWAVPFLIPLIQTVPFAPIDWSGKGAPWECRSFSVSCESSAMVAQAYTTKQRYKSHTSLSDAGISY